jgi:hypothetical protein
MICGVDQYTNNVILMVFLPVYGKKPEYPVARCGVLHQGKCGSSFTLLNKGSSTRLVLRVERQTRTLDFARDDICVQIAQTGTIYSRSYRFNRHNCSLNVILRSGSGEGSLYEEGKVTKDPVFGWQVA